MRSGPRRPAGGAEAAGAYRPGSWRPAPPSGQAGGRKAAPSANPASPAVPPQTSISCPVQTAVWKTRPPRGPAGSVCQRLATGSYIPPVGGGAGGAGALSSAAPLSAAPDGSALSALPSTGASLAVPQASSPRP